MTFNLFSKTSGFNAYLFPTSLALLKPAATARILLYSSKQLVIFLKKENQHPIFRNRLQ